MYVSCRGCKRSAEGGETRSRHPLSLLSGDWNSAVTAVLSGRRVRLSGLLPDTDYTLRPVAVTALGPGPPGRPLHVRTEPAPPSLPPGGLSLLPLSSTEVRAAWRAPPARGQHGQLTGYRVTFGRSVASRTGSPTAGQWRHIPGHLQQVSGL